MKIELKLFALLGILLLIPLAAAHEAADDKPKTSPDKLFYGLSVAVDKLSLALTSDKHAKASKGLAIAHERLLEIKAMREAGKLDKAQKSADNYAQTMDVVATAIDQTPEGETPEKTAEAIGETEAELSEVEDSAGDVTNALNADADVDGELTDAQKARIAKINEKIAKHQKAIARLEEKKSKLENKLFGEKLKETEEKSAKLEERAQRAEQAIVDAEEAIGKAFGVAPSLPRGQELLTNANSHLTKARDALAAKKYGEAFGQANAAFHIAKAMVKRSEQLAKKAEKDASRASSAAPRQTESGSGEKKTEKSTERAEKKAGKENTSSDMGRSEEEGNPAQKAKRAGEKTTESTPASSSGGY